MATAKKLPSGQWRVLSFVGMKDGKRQYKSFTAPTKREAELMAAQYLNEKEHVSASNMTVGDAIDIYISSKENTLSPRTVMDYKATRRNYIQELMTLPINNLSKSSVQKAFDSHSKQLSPKSLRNIYALFSSALALQDVRVPKITLPQKERKEMHIPTAEEINLLIEKFSADEDMQLAIMMAAYLGLRRSEICAVTTQDVFENEIRINKALVLTEHNEWVVKVPKSTAGYRTLPIPSVLQERLSTINRKEGENLVRINPNAITDRFYRKRTSCTELSHFRFHDLRHYYASVMLALGIPDKYAMERMGHATNNMLKNVYQHTMQSEQEKITKRIDEYFQKSTQKI